MTNDQKIATFDHAMRCVSDLHGSKTGYEHAAEAIECECDSGATLRNLVALRAETMIHARNTRRKRRVVNILDFSDLRTGSEEKVRP